MKKSILPILLMGLFLGCAHLGATNPVKRVFAVRQSDGTFLNVQKEGNGHFMFYISEDGYALLPGRTGDLEYVRRSSGGLRTTGILAHNISMRSIEERNLLHSDAINAAEAYSKMCVVTAVNEEDDMSALIDDGMREFGESADGNVRSIGKIDVPVVMVEFPDRAFLPGTTEDKLTRMLNKPGYDEERFCRGSVKDYFVSQSSGLFEPNFDIIAKVKVSKSYAYYGRNASDGRVDEHASDLVAEVLDSIKSGGVDVKKYIGADGNIPLLSIYHAGPGEHGSFEEGSDDYLWAHFSTRHVSSSGISVTSHLISNETTQAYKADTVIVGNDTVVGKYPVVIGAKIDGIGVFVHEFGHALGLPDFYRTAKDGIHFDTPNYWSVMDYGQFCYNGYAPMGYSAFERSSLGWLKVIELKEPQFVKLYPFGQENFGSTAFCIKNPANEKEYFLFENRQPGNWYSKKFGHGMLITHVDYDRSVWRNNIVNNDINRQRYEVVPADNVKNGRGEDGKTNFDFFKADLFPGLNGVTEFTDDTTPSSAVNTLGKLERPVYNIKETDGMISFSFLDKNLTGVDDVYMNDLNDDEDVYTISGHKVKGSGNLQRGVYLVRKNGKVMKLYVK